MIALGIIILILLIILLLPLGVDAAYMDGVFSLKAKAGPFSTGILPGKKKDGEKKEKKPKKPRAKKKSATEPGAEGKKKKKTKLKISFEDILCILRIALKALGRFRRSINVDRLMLHLSSGGSDPYSAVMNYGYFNSAHNALLPFLHRAFKIKDEDYASSVDFDSDKLKIDGQIVLTVRVGEILLIALCAAFAFLKWFVGFRRRNRAAAKKAANNENGKITENSSAEKGN